MKPVTIKPSVLKKDDLVYLITPSFQTTRHRIETSKRRLEALGLKVLVPNTIDAEDGYFAGTTKQKVNELHEGFKNPDVKALIAIRGGFGSARLLPHLDYELIKANPKIVLGYSDITALLLALHTKTGLITFHGPGGAPEIPEFTLNYYKELFFKNKLLTYKNKTTLKCDLISTEHQIYTIRSGITQGRLLGGNLTVLASLFGTSYLPNNWENIILFLEDTHEDPYRIDRLLLQMKLNGVLDKLNGVILGSFTHCTPKVYRSYNLEKIFEKIFLPLNIPCYYGAMIGHQAEQFILPIGAHVEMDAQRGEIRLLENPL